MTIFEELGFKAIENKDVYLSEQVIYNIALAYLMLNKNLAKSYKEFTLTPAKMNVLMILRHIEKGVGLQQNDISKRLIVTGANITGIIDRLEKDGLVERSKVKDRRVNLVKITQKGIKIVEKVWPIHIKTNEEFTGSLTMQEKKTMVELLTKLREGMKKE